MIHSATQSAKFKKLVRRLRPHFPSCAVSVQSVTIGILESLWHATIVSAQRGDIGRIDNETIAELVGWYDDPDALISYLIETGWIDEHPEHRLVVHDWSDHAPAFIKRNIDRKGGFICDVKQSLPCSGEQGSGRFSAQNNKEAGTHNITKPNATQQNETEPNQLPLEASVRDRVADPEPFLDFPIKPQSAGPWILNQDKVDQWTETFGDREWVHSQLKLARQWCLDNADRRKTAGGMARFLGSWLIKANNRGDGSQKKASKSRVATDEDLLNYNPNGNYE